MNPYPEYTLPNFTQSYKHDCSLFTLPKEEFACECIVCTALTNECTKCGEIQDKIQELKDIMENHIDQFREELMSQNKVNYIHIDAIHQITIRIKELQAITDNNHKYLARLSPIFIPK
jgi:hypothetical protein